MKDRKTLLDRKVWAGERAVSMLGKREDENPHLGAGTHRMLVRAL